MSSAILSSDDLNDFISPGVACIKPVETLPKQEDSNPYEVTTEDKVQAQNPAPASISLTDCLACSGCVTSAEAVLVSLQSHTEVLNTLDSHPPLDLSAADDPQSLNSQPDARLFVASISPQVRASIAATFGICERRAGNLIEQFLSGSQGLRIGGKHNSDFQYVVDTNQMREACLVLGADEVASALSNKSKPRPVITSACPGWICYAEKTHPHVLPHLSALKSPQALTGTLLKSVLSKKFGLHPSQIWHLAIMPCFDKKLEASREELTDRWWAPDQNEMDGPVRDVDCVITSRELLSLADARGIQLAQLPQTPVSRNQRLRFPDEAISNFLRPNSRSRLAQQREAGSSGGYLYHVLKTQQALHPGSHITMIRGRNADVLEYSLMSSSGEQIIKCARYYGFRNIQNLVRKLKPAKQSKLPGAARRVATTAGTPSNEYTYVEVMACPGGCTNGGGQIKVQDVADILPQTRGEIVEETKSVQSQREWLNRVDEAYFSADSEAEAEDEEDDSQISNSDNDTVMTDNTGSASATATDDNKDFINGIAVREIHDILHHWAQLVEVPLDKLAYTTFRKVESDVGKKKNIGDTERIAAIAGMSGGGW